MKKIFLAGVALAMVATTAEARDIVPGAVMVTGDTKIEIKSSEVSSSGASSTTDSSEINLAGLYFVAKNFGVGILVGSSTTETDNGISVTKQTTDMVGPVVGYNINISPEASIMLHGSIFSVTGKLDLGSSSVNVDGDGYMLGAFVNYFLNDSVAANFGLRTVKENIDLSSGGLTASGDLKETGASVGLSVFF